jgi:hypothetical protein
MRTRTLVTAGFTMVLAALVGTHSLTAGEDLAGHGASSDPDAYFVDGYSLDNSPQAAAAFPGNDIVVLAEVEGVLPPQWSNAQRTGPDSAVFIFTPIRVRVLDILRGSPRLQDGVMTVRRLGGRIGEAEYVFSEELAPSGLEPGNIVLLFLGEQRDLGDGHDASTPNMLYTVDAAGVARSSDGRWSLDLESFRAVLAR